MEFPLSNPIPSASIPPPPPPPITNPDLVVHIDENPEVMEAVDNTVQEVAVRGPEERVDFNNWMEERKSPTHPQLQKTQR
jgi:hypothetical protein